MDRTTYVDTELVAVYVGGELVSVYESEPRVAWDCARREANDRAEPSAPPGAWSRGEDGRVGYAKGGALALQLRELPHMFNVVVPTPPEGSFTLEEIVPWSGDGG